MVQIKICGLTRKKDVRRALNRGVDALGFILTASPRRISLTRVEKLTSGLPPFISTVGVVVNPSPGQIRKIIDSNLFTHLQLHGEEKPELIKNIPVKTIKTISISGRRDLRQINKYQNFTDYFLFDTKTGTRRGGSGITFDWSLLDNLQPEKPFILAGGLGPGNIVPALKRVNPAGVDLNSRIETAPGIKDEALMKKTIDEIRKFDRRVK